MYRVRRNRAHERGFTLLEVMIALAIISIALVALLGLTNRSILVHGHLQRITQATMLAQHKMAEVVDTEELNTEEGRFDEPFELYSWRVEYGDTPISSVTMVSVTVGWGEESDSEAVTLDSFIY